MVTIILWIMRFFKSFMAQPRLAMITKCVIAAYWSVCGVVGVCLLRARVHAKCGVLNVCLVCLCVCVLSVCLHVRECVCACVFARC